MNDRDAQTVVKTLWALIVFTGLLFLVLIVTSAQADVYADVSLGSMVGDIEQPEGGQVPFWGEVGYASHSIDYAVGHRSNADLNGIETDYEYVLIGRNFGRNVLGLPFYGRIEAQHAFTNDLKGENILALEGGFKQGGFRFGAFYETATTLNVHGLKAGYKF